MWSKHIESGEFADRTVRGQGAVLTRRKKTAKKIS
jgi:hypothetical protein